MKHLYCIQFQCTLPARVRHLAVNNVLLFVDGEGRHVNIDMDTDSAYRKMLHWRALLYLHFDHSVTSRGVECTLRMLLDVCWLRVMNSMSLSFTMTRPKYILHTVHAYME